MIAATIIADSISPEGHRLTTFELRYPKFIHGEGKTHRRIRMTNEGGVEVYHDLFQEVGVMDDPNLSRNASSSRAIPTKKYLEEVESDILRAAPVEWGKNQAGMQAKELLTGTDLQYAQECWKRAASAAVLEAKHMMRTGVHKQIVNRILEPYLHINVVVTATEYMNFFGLRLDAGAQPEIRALAEAMWGCYRSNTPDELKPGQWHLPYVSPEDRRALTGSRAGNADPNLIKISVARCARVSYKSFETGKESTLTEDLVLYDRLLGSQPIHASPAEHQATPDIYDFTNDGLKRWFYPQEHGNFTGWRQYRKTLPGEAIAPLPEQYR